MLYLKKGKKRQIQSRIKITFDPASFYNSQSISRVLYPPEEGCLSFIYTLCHHNAKAFYPPARASNPQTPVYMNLQPPRRTARTSLHSRWALTPPSHPYLQAGGYFLLRYSAFTNSFLLGSGVLYAARTFLLCTWQRRQTDQLFCYILNSAAKIQQRNET